MRTDKHGNPIPDESFDFDISTIPESEIDKRYSAGTLEKFRQRDERIKATMERVRKERAGKKE